MPDAFKKTVTFSIWNILKRIVENENFYEGFRFRKHRDSKMAHLWRCVKITCKARCTDIEDTMILVERFDHDHVEEEIRTV